ncbi:MAG TPA: VCBS repeat-containing protein [Gemmatimonadaceae bacterium]|nr:VCBS repeat-containing protein [Gemmatimonadaceae bacterium]
MPIRNKRYLALAIGSLLAAACRETKPATPPLFELLDSARTGIAFVNAVPETPQFNIVNYLYYYNGGGVAVGDVNGDGLMDLYFSSNLGSNRLYLNRGDYRFEDVTDRAGVSGPPGWKTGVTMADVNGDGHVDIYVCAVNYLTMHGRNVLYVNNADGTFTDRTAQYGLQFEGYATQALFFDYDRDGDLDMYLLNNSTHGERTAVVDTQPSGRNARVSDRLYRNDHNHFVDVSAAAGLHGGIDYGLGVVASDFNDDGCPDLYVANDFQENDYLYVNNCNGTFRDSITTATGHTSQFSMGVDAADFNNDLRSDIIVADMLPDREDIAKTSTTAESWDLYSLRLRSGFHPQFSRNTLQLNRGSVDRRSLRFSDMAPMAGVAATDWSWAPLFADLDNDGRKDVFITSGIYRRPNDLDYIAYVGNPAVQQMLARGDSSAMLALLQRMPHVAAPNRAFRNEGGLSFRDVGGVWGLAQRGFSNGAAYVDLTNSGRFDLVVNRLDAPAAIYRNTGAGTGHFLELRLRGARANTDGIGARVTLSAGGQRQMLEQMPTRGFQSSVDPRLHFGLGAVFAVDTLAITWPGGASQTFTFVPGDRLFTLYEDSARFHTAPPRVAPVPLFVDVTARSGLTFVHRENGLVDFVREPLIPRALSAEGPALAVGDVDGDGLDDVYIGGAKWQRGALYLQQPGGTFRESAVASAAFAADSLVEDVDAAFFDANGDGRPDLYVVSGGNEFTGTDAPLQDRLYVNEGGGRFRRDTTALPVMRESGACVVVGDFTGDGRPDLFVGRRAVALRYGESPRSYLLENDGRGHFRDITDAEAPQLASAGMVTGAAWMDYDGDGKLDLVVVGDWMPVRAFHQEGGKLIDRGASAGFTDSEGWWSSVSVADVNGDGLPDLVLGNAGLNFVQRATHERPLRLYVGPFAGDSTSIPVIAAQSGDGSYPIESRDELLAAVPALQSRFPTFHSFGAARIEDVLSRKDRRRASVRNTENLATVVALNIHGGFELRPLPGEVNLAPVNAALAGDFDGDGVQDLILAGNNFGVAPVLGRQDGSYGLLLRGVRSGNFAPVEMAQSGILIDGQVRHMARVRTRNGYLIVVARNNDTVKVLRPTR